MNPVLDLTQCIFLFAERTCRSARAGLDWFDREKRLDAKTHK